MILLLVYDASGFLMLTQQHYVEVYVNHTKMTIKNFLKKYTNHGLTSFQLIVHSLLIFKFFYEHLGKILNFSRKFSVKMTNIHTERISLIQLYQGIDTVVTWQRLNQELLQFNFLKNFKNTNL